MEKLKQHGIPVTENDQELFLNNYWKDPEKTAIDLKKLKQILRIRKSGQFESRLPAKGGPLDSPKMSPAWQLQFILWTLPDGTWFSLTALTLIFFAELAIHLSYTSLKHPTFGGTAVGRPCRSFSNQYRWSI